MKTQADYLKLAADLAKIEKAKAVNGRSLYLADELVDSANVLERGDVVEGSADYWKAMCNAAGSAAGDRAEEYGFNINKALGYIVY